MFLVKCVLLVFVFFSVFWLKNHFFYLVCRIYSLVPERLRHRQPSGNALFKVHIRFSLLELIKFKHMGKIVREANYTNQNAYKYIIHR
jgi:hypothetical protein